MSIHEQEFFNIEKHILKVHINCEGCLMRVRSLLKKIEGVYTVDIDIEQQKVMVIGRVDSAVLIKKLVRSGKHAELCLPGSDPQEAKQIRDHGNNYQTQDARTDVNTFKNQQALPSFRGKGENGWSSDWYCNPSMVTPGTGGEFEQNPVAATLMNTVYAGRGGEINHHRMSLIDHSGLHGNGDNISGLRNQHFDGSHYLPTGLPMFDYDQSMINMQRYPNSYQ